MSRKFFNLSTFLCFAFVLLLPLFDSFLPQNFQIADKVRVIFVFTFLALGLHILTGYTGLLNLGVSAFMAIGAYIFAITTCDIYPFQIGFWGGLLAAIIFGAFVGIILGLPTLRLRGDYLAIVTLGFGEIAQDCLRNLEVITKGTQGINPLPPPTIGSMPIESISPYGWYYLLLAFLVVAFWLVWNLEHSRVGRSLRALREDELAARCMGISPLRTKLIAFSLCAAFCAFAGALWASLLGSSGEPGNYDFQISILALCIVIVGGMGNLKGVLLGAAIMVGMNSIVLVKLTELIVRSGLAESDSVFLSPNNWKYSIFGLALVLMMRFRPQGILSCRH